MKKTSINLIPNIKNPTPDYYCTWQTQLYATNDGKPQGQRALIGEKALFCKEKPYGWAYFYEQVRDNLFLVMDDSWDVPVNNDLSYLGSLILDKEKFASFVGDSSNNVNALKKLSDKIKALGWKGLGGWVCAQESSQYIGELSWEEYWTKRLTEANEAGISYWKVDWGKWCRNLERRQKLTQLGRKYAPNLVIEHSMILDAIPFSDTFRTYDVPAIMSIPMTMEKIANLSSAENCRNGNMCLINCEDEVYISAACGFAMGIMRHPFSGAFVNGNADMSFPLCHRNLKTKIYEVIRAVNFHKIAPAFAFSGKDLYISENILYDNWKFEKIEEEIESWWFEQASVADYVSDNILTKNGPAIISRNTNLPVVTPNVNGLVPFVIASKNPNGAYAVATLGRTSQRDYHIPKCNVKINAENSKTIGVFGEYENLIINTNIDTVNRILIQDLADQNAYDITHDVTFKKGSIIISGKLIKDVCMLIQPEDDTSEPGVVIQII